MVFWKIVGAMSAEAAALWALWWTRLSSEPLGGPFSRQGWLAGDVLAHWHLGGASVSSGYIGSEAEAPDL